jgi:hypothetical protein
LVVIERVQTLHETVNRPAVKVYRKQEDMYRELANEIKGSRAKAASLIQYSGSSCLDVIRELAEEGASIKLYLQNSLTANHVAAGFAYDPKKPDSHQAERIKKKHKHLKDDLGHLWKTAKIEVRQCSCPASAMVVKIDDWFLAVGWYMYYPRPAEEQDDNDKVQTLAHDVPVVVARKGSLEFDILNSFVMEILDKLSGSELVFAQPATPDSGKTPAKGVGVGD